MGLTIAPRITQRTVIRILIGGFTLVLLLLPGAAYVAVRATGNIQAGAGRLLREQLLTARLINDVQQEQGTLSAISFELSRGGGPARRGQLLRQLNETETDLERIVASGAGTAEARMYSDLDRAARAFAAEARLLLAAERITPAQSGHLFTLHAEVFRQAAHLVSTSSERAAAMESQIEAQSEDAANNSLTLLGLCLLLALLCAALTVRMATSSFRAMQTQAEELSRVSWHMLESQEVTARRFSHELHDELGQSLAAVKANLMGLSAANLEAKQSDCLHLVDGAISNVRELSQLLRPVILDDFGIDAALRWLTGKFAQRTQIEVVFECPFHERLAEDTETHLFRIAQEALTNVARHSRATQVHMELRRDGDVIQLRIADNGRGMEGRSHRNVPSLGLVGMRARARHAGGELSLREGERGGLVVAVWVPYKTRSDAAEQEDSHLVGG